MEALLDAKDYPGLVNLQTWIRTKLNANDLRMVG